MQMGDACAPLATASATLALRPMYAHAHWRERKKSFLVYSFSADALNQEEDLNLSTHDRNYTFCILLVSTQHTQRSRWQDISHCEPGKLPRRERIIWKRLGYQNRRSLLSLRVCREDYLSPPHLSADLNIRAHLPQTSVIDGAICIPAVFRRHTWAARSKRHAPCDVTARRMGEASGCQS